MRAVNTTHGRIETECVINAAGQWAPRIAEMVGTNLPMTPLMHQYLLTRPIHGQAAAQRKRRWCATPTIWCICARRMVDF